MSRIESGKISLGNSYVLNADGQAKANKEISDAKILADSIIAEAQKKAQATLTQAQQQADSLVAQAKAQAEAEKEQITAESRKMGYEDGYQDGKEKITTELENLVYNVNNFAKCQFDMKNRIIKSIHTDILDMVLDISEKICLTELRQNKEILTKIVANAISQLKEKESVTIIVNPEMARKIYEISNDLKDAIHNLEHIKIVEDATIAPDGTIVESVGSRVDARVSAQIEQIAQKLFAELNKTPEIELTRELDDVEAQLNNDKPEQI